MGRASSDDDDDNDEDGSDCSSFEGREVRLAALFTCHWTVSVDVAAYDIVIGVGVDNGTDVILIDIFVEIDNDSGHLHFVVVS